MQVDVTVAELDGAIVECAARHFGLRLAGGAASAVASLELPLAPLPQGHVRVVVGDGIDLVRRLATAGVPADAVLVDADAKDLSTGRSFPPPAFLAPPFLADVAELLRARGGTAVLNVAARSRVLFDASVDAVRVGLVAAGVGPSTDNKSSAAASASWEVSCASVDAEDLNSLVVATCRHPLSLAEAAVLPSEADSSQSGREVVFPLAVRRWLSKWGALFAQPAS